MNFVNLHSYIGNIFANLLFINIRLKGSSGSFSEKKNVCFLCIKKTTKRLTFPYKDTVPENELFIWRIQFKIITTANIDSYTHPL